MKKIIANFGPGPCYVEPRVLDAFDNAGYGEEGFMGTGIPIGSTSHRSKTFLDNVLKPLNELTRELLEIPDNYSILWTRDGATEQWTRIARNFSSSLINYIHTGDFSKRAYKTNYTILNPRVDTVVFPSFDFNNPLKPEDFNHIPLRKPYSKDFTHITWNNTVEGVEFQENHLNFYKNCILFADATSNIFSKRIEWEKYNFGMVYASTTKQLGGAGSCLVIIRNDLLVKTSNCISDSESYKVLVEKDSGLYTSNVDALLKALKTLEFYKEQGGVEAYEKLNKQKAKLLYDVIDESEGFYIGHAREDSRSLMNVVFYLQDSSLKEKFLEEAEKEGLLYLKGHANLKDSLRASIYNMMPIEDVQRLANFMNKFLEDNS